MSVIEIRQTERFVRWFGSLRDSRARMRIQARIRGLTLGNFGDVRPVGEGVSELRIDYAQAIAFISSNGEMRLSYFSQAETRARKIAI